MNAVVVLLIVLLLVQVLTDYCQKIVVSQKYLLLHSWWWSTLPADSASYHLNYLLLVVQQLQAMLVYFYCPIHELLNWRSDWRRFAHADERSAVIRWWYPDVWWQFLNLYLSYNWVEGLFLTCWNGTILFLIKIYNLVAGKTLLFILLRSSNSIFLHFRPWSDMILPSRSQIGESIFQNKSKIDLVRITSLLICQIYFFVIPANKFRSQKIISLVISTSQHPTCN